MASVQIPLCVVKLCMIASLRYCALNELTVVFQCFVTLAKHRSDLPQVAKDTLQKESLGNDCALAFP